MLKSVGILREESLLLMSQLTKMEKARDAAVLGLAGRSREALALETRATILCDNPDLLSCHDSTILQPGTYFKHGSGRSRQ